MSAYYVDTAGDDENSGLSELLPWETIDKVNDSSFNAGDSVSFNKTCTWREQLTVPSSGSAGNPITFGAYGTGADPIILGSVSKNDTGDWTEDSGIETKFSSGFEANDFSEWTSEGDTAGYLNPSSGQAHSGTYSAYWNHTGNQSTTLVKTGITTANNPTFSVELYPNNTSDPDGCFYVRTADGSDCFKFTVRYSSGWKITLTWYDDAGTGTAFSAYALTAGQWNKIEVLVTTASVGGNNGGYELLIDGASKQSIANVDNDVRGLIGRITVEMYNNGTQIYMDDLAVTVAGGATNLWYAGGITVDATVVWRDGARMTLAASKVAMDADGEWWMDGPNDRVYVYHVGNPGTTHDFEISQRAYCITATDKGYITADGLTMRYANTDVIRLTRSAATLPYWTVTNSTLSGAYGMILNTIGSAINQFDNFTFTHNSVSDFGGNAGSSSCAVFISYGDAFDIHGNTFTYSSNANNTYSRSVWVRFTGTSDTGCKIYENIFDGIETGGNASAVLLSSAYYVQVYYNKFVGNYARAIWTDETTLNANDGSFYCKIHHNFVDLGANGSYGMNIETTYKDEIYYNVIDMRDGTDAWGLWLGIGAVSGDASTKVYNNTILTAGGGITAQFGWTGYGRYLENLTVKNNIFYFSGDGGACMSVQKLDGGLAENGHVFDYNCYFDAGTAAYHIGWFGSFYTTAAALHAAHDTEETHGVTADPLFTNVGGGNFTLQAGSPCIDAGVNLGTDYQMALAPGSTWP